MREMKDSGIEWIGEIPKRWKKINLKYICDFKTGGTPQNKKGIDVDGDYKWITPADFTESYRITDSNQYISAKAISDNGYTLFPVNSVLLVCIASVGKVGIIDKPSYSNQQITALKPNNLSCSKYLMYSLVAAAQKIQFDASSNVVPIVNTKYLQGFTIPFPTVVEQRMIANFLDAKCAEIDALTADIQTQIDTLEQYKQSVITETVTKGLNPDAKMKDSGTPWCPLIPIHWKYANPKALFTQRLDRAYPGDKQLTASQEYGVIYQDEYMELTGTKIVTVMKDFSILKHVEPNDFVISMRSFQGGLEYSERRGSISSAYVMLIPNSEYVYPPFYRWFFKSSKYINAIQSTSNLVRDGQAMRYANFAQVPLFIIPLDEQKQISEYLDEKVRKIDEILESKKNQLEILAEYKKSLIYEYVTGKKEVPANEK